LRCFSGTALEPRQIELLAEQKKTIGFATGAAGIGPIAVPEKYRNQPPTAGRLSLSFRAGWPSESAG